MLVNLYLVFHQYNGQFKWNPENYESLMGHFYGFSEKITRNS